MADLTNPIFRTDAYIRHEMEVQRFAISTSRKFRAENMSRIERKYAEILSQFSDIKTRTEANRLATKLASEVSAILEEEVAAIGIELDTYARFESGWNQGTLSVVIGETAKAAAPEAIVKRAANHLMDSGETVDEFTKRTILNNRRVARASVLSGWQDGKTNAQITKDILGTKGLKFRDGSLETVRRSVDAVVRTTINAIADNARSETFRQNRDFVKKEMIVATLDGRTSAICQFYDHQVFNLGEGPRPPFHPNCRSLTVPLFKGENADDIVGLRPAVGSGKDYDRGSNVTRTGRVRKPRKGDDRFKITRMKASTDYDQFLSRQNVAFQEDVLGVTRAKLFRSGGLSIDDMTVTTKRGFFERNLTLSELAKRESDAFVKAGLDPKNYL